MNGKSFVRGYLGRAMVLHIRLIQIRANSRIQTSRTIISRYRWLNGNVGAGQMIHDSIEAVKKPQLSLQLSLGQAV